MAQSDDILKRNDIINTMLEMTMCVVSEEIGAKTYSLCKLKQIKSF